MKQCSTPRCSNPASRRDLCDMHRQREAALRKKTNACRCGCGGLTRYAFVAGHQTRLLPVAEQRRRARLNDGSTQRDRGTKDWYRKVLGRHEHRRVAEATLGRQLTSAEVVHHVDGNKKDNTPSNLVVMSRAEHIAEHRHAMNEGRRRRSDVSR